MNKYSLIRVISAATLLATVAITPAAYAASSEVKWTDPDSYQDIDEEDDFLGDFRESVFANFEKYFTKMAASLPEGYVLKIEVTDLDLAGDIRAGSMQRLRVVKSMYPPRINFSYKLENTVGGVVQSADVELKDLSFLSGSNIKYRDDPLGYEKKMLDDWFKKTFSELAVSP